METSEIRNGAKRVGAELEERTLAFAVQVVGFTAAFHRSDAASVIGRQLVRAGTAMGANYREANRADSADDFAHKVAVALKEAAETEYWLLLCARTNIGESASRSSLTGESGQLIAILATILRRARAAHK